MKPEDLADRFRKMFEYMAEEYHPKELIIADGAGFHKFVKVEGEWVETGFETQQEETDEEGTEN